MLLVQLFFEFFKTGLFAIGGGLATLPFLQEMSVRTGWFSLDDLQNMIAVSESTPGPIGVNMATYVGFTTAGIPGALTATLGLALPSFLIILIISIFLKRYMRSPVVEAAFSGLRPASTALIAAVLLSLIVSNFINTGKWKGFSWESFSIFRWEALLLGLVIWIATRVWKKAHPALFLLAGAAAGILLKL